MKQDSGNLPEGSAICAVRILDGARRSLLGQMVARLRSEIPDAVGIYVFGSWGTTAERRDSDLDLAVLPKWELAPPRSWHIAQELAGLVGQNVDLVDLRMASTVMRAQVIAHGERLYCGDERQCTEFEDLAFSNYARLNEERAEILEDIQRQGSIYSR